MSDLTFDLEVTYDDDRTEQVTADQRDIAAWEIQPFGCSVGRALRERTHSLFRYLAWHALNRQKRTQLQWEAWSDKAVQVDAVNEDEEETEADPGKPTADDAASSGSPS